MTRRGGGRGEPESFTHRELWEWFLGHSAPGNKAGGQLARVLLSPPSEETEGNCPGGRKQSGSLIEVLGPPRPFLDFPPFRIQNLLTTEVAKSWGRMQQYCSKSTLNDSQPGSPERSVGIESKRKLAFWGLLDTRTSSIVMTAWSQEESRLRVPLPVDPLGPTDPLSGHIRISKCIIAMGILNIWHNSHIDTLSVGNSSWRETK